MSILLIIFFFFCFNHVSSQPKILDLFPVQNYDSIQSFNMGRYLGNKIPDNYVLKYFDHVANTYNLNLFNGNKKSYYSIARIKEGDYWILVLCSYDSIYKDIFLFTFDEIIDETISKIHIKRELCGIEENLSYFFYHDKKTHGKKELKTRRIFPCSVEGEPTLQHEKYKLDRRITRIEKDDVVFKNGCLGYDIIPINQNIDTLNTINKILDLFPTLTGIEQIPTTPPSHLFLLKEIPYEVMTRLFGKTKNECEYNLYNRYPLFYYAIGKIRIKYNWVLCYCETDTYEHNMFLAIIPNSKERVSSELLIFNNKQCHSIIKNNYIYISFKYPNWHDGLSINRRERYIIDDHFIKYPK